MFMIGGLPFTFEDEGFDPTDADIVAQANTNPHITMEQLYQWSDYLIMEDIIQSYLRCLISSKTIKMCQIGSVG